MKKRVVIIVAEVAFVLFALGGLLSLSAADTSAAALPGTLSVTILNKAANTADRIKVYYDHNENNIDYLAGIHVGAEVCASGGDVSLVDAVISGLPGYDGNNDENEFELGRNESDTRDLGTIADGECTYAYWFVATPRFKNGGSEIPTTVAVGMTATFTVTANGDDGAFAPVSAFDTATMVVDGAISAASSSILQFSTESVSYYTLTVLYDLGNAGGEQDGTVAATGWITHDAGVFDMVTTTVRITDSTDTAVKYDNAQYVTGLTGNAYVAKGIYVFEKVGPGGTIFYPYSIISSGGQDKYNGDLGDVSIPLAISLRQLEIGNNQQLIFLIVVSFTMILSVLTFFVLRRRKNEFF